MNRLISIIVACFIGGLIGTLVSLELTSVPFVGLIVGAVLGYFLVDVRHLVTGIAKTWRTAISGKTNWKNVKRNSLLCATLCSVGFQFFLGLMLLSGILIGFDKLQAKLSENPFPPLFASGVFAIYFLLLVLLIQVLGAPSVNIGAERFLKQTSPLRYNIVYGFLRLVRWVVTRFVPVHIPTLVRFMIRFGRLAFVFVHSDRRLICLFASGFGTLVGYGLDSAIAGGMTGVVLGLIMYQLISVHWLKLQPATT